MRCEMINFIKKQRPGDNPYILNELGVGYRMVEGESERDPGDPEA